MSHLDIQQACVSYGNSKLEAVKNISLTLKHGEIGCFLGPSGSGKTTLLRAIAGFEPLSEGVIELNNKTVASKQFSLPAEQRNVGMVFQDFALFPHLNVEKNITFGIRHLSKQEQQQRLDVLLNLIDLKPYVNSFPHELSGGQQQRVALARALATQPDILLMDEPFSSLDAELREQLAEEVRSLLKQYNMTAILVTHDQQEAFAMADKVAVLKQGELLQWDSAYNLYHNPVSRFVANFIGKGFLLNAQVNEQGELINGLGVVGTRDPREAGRQYEVLVRPDDLVFDENSTMQLEICKKEFRGAENFYYLRLPDEQTVLCATPSHINKAVGEFLPVMRDIQHLVTFVK